MLLEMGVRVWLPGTAFAPETVKPQALSVEPVQPSPPLRARADATVVQVPAVAPSLQGLNAIALAEAAASCQACGLCKGRKNTTLRPIASVQADWFVLGDPPDEDEDAQGLPFAAQAGELLDNMLKAIGARRGDAGAAGAYVSNVVKCRPPLGRLPTPEELAQCAGFLRQELEWVQPKLILAMGRSATQLLLGEHPEATGLPLGKQRGQVYRYAGIPVVVTYAPKVLLRAAADKGKAWADLCLAMDVRDGIAPLPATD
ncbi:MAG: uracil-DNA glycosylase [Burkholderiales bacterium PBB4]|nr:MAG: uracil-DNA glycosylase [Burkholderiales bacterium PBB4]